MVPIQEHQGLVSSEITDLLKEQHVEQQDLSKKNSKGRTYSS